MARRVGLWTSRCIAGGAALLPLAGCAPEPRALGSGPEPELRWYRDRAIEAAGGDTPAMLADPGGGLWVAVAGVSNASGRSRLFYRPPGGAWSAVHEGPFATELSLSSARAGAVYLGFNLPLDGFRPTLLAVGKEGVRALPAPDERIDALEHLQIGGYAMLSDDEGFACGQRGTLFRLSEGRWMAEPQVLSWRPGDPAAKSFCRSIRMEGARGFLVDWGGEAAAWDGARWRRVERDPARSLVALDGGVAQEGRSILRWDGAAWRRLAGDLPSADRPLIDPSARWAAQPEGVSALEPDAVRALPGHLPFTPTAITEADGDLWALAQDGIYRATRRNVPTFAPAHAGAIPVGLAYAIALDLDEDGDEDLLGLSARASETAMGASTLVAMLNDGAGRFTAASLGLPDDVRNWRDHFDAGDVDGDGDIDIVTSTTHNRVELWRWEGARFSLAFSRAAPDATVALVDIDGDGDLDLSLIPGEPALLLNDGAGSFREPRAAPRPASTVERATWADVDDDGDADAVLQHWRDPAHLLVNEGSSFALAELSVVAEGAAFADLDLDGAPELYAQKIHLRNMALPFSRCRIVDRACSLEVGPEVPAGIVTDLNLDGSRDVIASDLRGDEAMIADGEIFLGTHGGAGEVPRWERVTAITGSMPRPTVIDADGDGDPDVYSTSVGLHLNTANPRGALRVRTRASRSDRLARGAWIVARRAGGGPVVGSARADHGSVTLGLPERDASYDVEVRFPAGERRVALSIRPGTEIVVRDAGDAAYAARLALLWITGTVKRAHLLRDVALPALVALFTLTLARRARAKRLGIAAAAGAAAYLLLAGSLLRQGGAGPWMLVPAPLGAAVIARAWVTRRDRRLSALRAGPYRLVERLGAGAAATVWRARVGVSEVALKLFSAEAMSSSEARERFFREARVGAEIEHPNVVKIRDSGRLEDGRCYLAMQLVAGRSLDACLRERGCLPPEEATSIAVDLARALEALHGAGIVHRDVKPENAMVRPDGSAVLTDLGLARSALFRTLTRHDVAVGTLAYMSPEQCVGRPLDGRSDLWSLGVVLYEMLTGRRPFLAEHELELVYVIHNVDPPPPSAIVPGIPAELDVIALRCLARDPEDRFASARSLADALVAVRGAL